MSESAASADSERRQHPRVLAFLQVRYRPLSHNEVDTLLKGLGDENPVLPALGMKKTPAGTLSMVSTNLSAGGISAAGDLQILGQDQISKGSDIVVEMDLGDHEDPVRAIAQVMWTAPQSDGKHLAGMMFMVISDSNLNRIHTYVERAIKDDKLVR